MNTLTVLFTIYELTISDFDLYVSLSMLKEKCKLSEEVIREALVNIPYQLKESDNGQTQYRIEGYFMHIPALLLMIGSK